MFFLSKNSNEIIKTSESELFLFLKVFYFFALRRED